MAFASKGFDKQAPHGPNSVGLQGSPEHSIKP